MGDKISRLISEYMSIFQDSLGTYYVQGIFMNM